MTCHHLNYGGYPMQILPVGLLGSGGILHRMFHSLRHSRFGVASALILLGSVCSPILGHAQQSPLLSAAIQSSDTAATYDDTTGASSSSTHPTPDPADLEVSWRKMPARFLHDQKDIWLFPVKLGKGKNWLPAAIVIGGTAAFIVEDPPLERKVRQTDIFTDYNKVFKSSVSGGIIVIVPVGFYAVSLLRHDSYGQGTALLAGEAVANDTILMVVLKAITRRARPSEFPPDGAYNDTFFATHNSIFGKGSSFPSGHAMMAFSVADVFAQRYRHHKWVPYVAYTLATAIGFSRVTTGAHFPSDVFIGAALGFSISHFDVLRH
jgi:membrane-associated phospholipid phosphatase